MNLTLWWQQLLLAMAGGAVGSGLRFAVGSALLQRYGAGFPWGTLAVNLAGAFVGGFLLVWIEGRGASAPYWRALLIVGLVGGLTTFSSLMMESMLFVRNGRLGMVPLYLAITLAAGLVLVFAGARTAAELRAPTMTADR
ncbi:fluoride efflux transporter CrcB [Xanthomonas sp. A2111]|uniref:Fluoride-specific ion channel FluC n=1 Tax=Xanthomonas hawaiiensis TaxID=3003247 RepID=A0ABU2HZ66_9XANT|nr:fluoride efflux transporter CrcB [Xanthomonas sp. A2111]MBO9830282.1 fluoride efflux transporter CrcB [Xanthomonas sp. A2111]MDS9991195.1 fluoride efflux transporter CrcB [Xanthomonas sp. A2111]